MTGFPQVILNPKILTLTIFFISLLHFHLPDPGHRHVAYNATDIILLDCGAWSNTISQDDRRWDADSRSVYSSFNDPNSSFSSYASLQSPSVPTVPYLSARIIKSKFTYSFHVSPGPKFLRLYFYPEKYSTLDMTTSFFSVTASNYTLLKNFNAHLHLMTHEDFLIKEFIVPVWDNEILNVTFIPSTNSYAFINGIEIVSMPSGLYLSGRQIPLVTEVVGESFSLDNTTTSLETLYRLNVGGNRIENVNDTGMYRTWSQDGGYLVGSNWTILNKSNRLQFTRRTPAYTAPEEVYTTSRMMGNNFWLNLKSNMTWRLTVDPGFYYLIRLHFCELLQTITGSYEHVFDISINNQIAEENINMFSKSGGNGFPMFKDYIVMADNRTHGRDLWLALHPAQSAVTMDAFLNGLEIFKLNQSDGNLAGPNPDSHQKLLEGPKSKVTSIILPIIAAILGGFALVSLLVSFFVFQRQRKPKDSNLCYGGGESSSTYHTLGQGSRVFDPISLPHTSEIIPIKKKGREEKKGSNVTYGVSGSSTTYHLPGQSLEALDPIPSPYSQKIAPVHKKEKEKKKDSNLTYEVGRSSTACHQFGEGSRDRGSIPLCHSPKIVPVQKQKKERKKDSNFTYAVGGGNTTAGHPLGQASKVLGLIPFPHFPKIMPAQKKKKYITTKTYPLLLSNICCHFSIADLKAATQGFNDKLLIGKGGFGNVYRGIINGGTTIAAIKRLNPSSMQGAHEFHTEIDMLSRLRHRHLVSLIGYCDDDGEMILLYDYMAHGTFRDHLYNTKNLPLSWKQRLEICIGAARGLHYLHREAKQVIIHRDVKSTNILLDENNVANVSDFGLSKLGPISTSQTHVSTVVKGSFGYLDPEYCLRQQLTEKSDVYSFGVVLFEVLCGKPPLFENLLGNKVSLAQWARSCYQRGSLDEIVDPYLAGQIAPMALQKFAEVAKDCIRERGNERPTMRDVVLALESTLQLQETEEENTNDSDATITYEG